MSTSASNVSCDGLVREWLLMEGDMAQPSILYTAEMDLPDTDVEAFLAWYAFRHAPQLYQVGFDTCTCYRSVKGDMNILDIYQASSMDVFASSGYRDMMSNDPYGEQLMARRRNKAHTVYAERVIAPSVEDKPARLDCDWVSLIRFAAPEESEAEVVELVTAGAPLIAPGSERWRLAHRTTDHPTNPTFRPRWLLVIEWRERPPPEAAPVKYLRDQFGRTIGQIDGFLGHRVYPWPDRKPASLKS